MRTLLTVIFAFLAFTATPQDGGKNKKAVIHSTFYCTHCKVCETCGQSFQDNLYKIKGLKMFEIDEKAMTITVYYNSRKTDLQTIRTAISKLGFDADEVKADPVAYSNLDQCCKKE